MPKRLKLVYFPPSSAQVKSLTPNPAKGSRIFRIGGKGQERPRPRLLLKLKYKGRRNRQVFFYNARYAFVLHIFCLVYSDLKKIIGVIVALNVLNNLYWDSCKLCISF